MVPDLIGYPPHHHGLQDSSVTSSFHTQHFVGKRRFTKLSTPWIRLAIRVAVGAWHVKWLSHHAGNAPRLGYSVRKQDRFDGSKVLRLGQQREGTLQQRKCRHMMWWLSAIIRSLGWRPGGLWVWSSMLKLNRLSAFTSTASLTATYKCHRLSVSTFAHSSFR